MKLDPISLASSSPRRTELLTQAGIPHVVVRANVDEEAIVSREGHEQTALLRAQAKANAAALAPGTRIILAADTVVVSGSQSFEKPPSVAEARAMIRALSGRDHFVSTAIATHMPQNGKRESHIVTTTVTFRELSESEIDWYLDTNEWQGVAGGYRIQGFAARFIPAVTGSYSNVVGLPIATVYSMVSRFQFNLEQNSGA